MESNSIAIRSRLAYANQFPLNQKQRLGTQQEISEKGLVGGPSIFKPEGKTICALLFRQAWGDRVRNVRFKQR